jgi:hypothetical protein
MVPDFASLGAVRAGYPGTDPAPVVEMSGGLLYSDPFPTGEANIVVKVCGG